MDNKKKLRIILTHICVLFLLTACVPRYATTEKKISWPRDYEFETNAIGSKIPLRAGLYLSDFFINYRHQPTGPRDPVLGGTILGDALGTASGKMIKSIFSDVAIIDNMASEEKIKDRGIDVILSPEVTKVITYPRGFVLFVEITIKWVVFSPDGKMIYSSAITGEGSVKGSWTFSSDTKIKEIEGGYLASIIDHFQKAQKDIYGNEWWKKEWWKE